MTAWENYQRTMIAAPTLWSAAKDDDVATLAVLLDADPAPNIDARDPRGHSPLMLAAYAGNARSFDYLLSRGADPNSADPSGNTVLMGTAFKGHLDLLQKLLTAGADHGAKNVAGLDARGFAQMFGRLDAVALLEKHTASSGS